ncbi:MAG: hypothetical protein JO296_13150 [Pseudonocardiales bacterium]|nr:hypothetical protein [Pseudonocardiales bacterium]
MGAGIAHLSFLGGVRWRESPPIRYFLDDPQPPGVTFRVPQEMSHRAFPAVTMASPLRTLPPQRIAASILTLLRDSA